MFTMGPVHTRDNSLECSGAKPEHAAKRNRRKGLIFMS